MSDTVSDYSFPFMAPMISRSRNPDEQYPVLGLHITPEFSVEIQMDDFMPLMSKMEGTMKVANLPSVDDREVVASIKKDEGIIKFFVGSEKTPLDSPDGAEYELTLELFDIGIAMMQFIERAESFIES